MTAPQWGTYGATRTSAATSRPTVESSPPMFVPTVIVSTAPAHVLPTLIAPDSGSSAASPEFLFALDEAALQRIRRTAETPPRVSILDVIGAITGQARNNCAAVWSRLRESRPDVAARCGFFKFPGRRQRKTPVAGAGAILDIVMILPGQAAVALRQQTAAALVHYLDENDTPAREALPSVGNNRPGNSVLERRWSRDEDFYLCYCQKRPSAMSASTALSTGLSSNGTAQKGFAEHQAAPKSHKTDEPLPA